MKRTSTAFRHAPLRTALVLGLLAGGASWAQAQTQAAHVGGESRPGAPFVNASSTNGAAMAAPPGRTVASLLDYARENNPEYAAMRYEAQAAQERIEPAGALMDPKVQIEWRDITKMGEQGATLSPSRVGSTKYLLMQDLPWYGKRDLKREIAELEAAGAEGRARGNWAELSAKVKALHTQLYTVEHNAALAREILDLMLRLERLAQLRYGSGLAAQADVIRAQSEQTAMRNELILLDNEKRQLEARLNGLLARPAGAPLAAPEQLRPLPAPAQLEFDTLAERVRARNPRLFSDGHGIRAAEKNRELTLKNRYPDFTVGVSPIQYQSEVKEWEVMLQFNLPLQQGTRRAQEREAEAMLAAAQARKEASVNQIFSELAENLSALDAARRSATLIEDSLLPQAELTLRSALAAYENGKVDFATLLEAQRQIRQARVNLLKTQGDARVRLAEVERLLGDEL